MARPAEAKYVRGSHVGSLQVGSSHTTSIAPFPCGLQQGSILADYSPSVCPLVHGPSGRAAREFAARFSSYVAAAAGTAMRRGCCRKRRVVQPYWWKSCMTPYMFTIRSSFLRLWYIRSCRSFIICSTRPFRIDTLSGISCLSVGRRCYDAQKHCADAHLRLC